MVRAQFLNTPALMDERFGHTPSRWYIIHSDEIMTLFPGARISYTNTVPQGFR